MSYPEVRWIAANTRAVTETLSRLGVSPEGSAVMAPKVRGQALLIRRAPAGLLIGLKATLNRFGADLALPAGAGGCASETPGEPLELFDALVLGSERAIRRACTQANPPTADLAAALIAALDRARGPAELRARDHRFALGGRSPILGILNRTPDSLTDRGRPFAWDVALRRADQMIQEGVDIIEVGGQTAQPDRPPVGVEEEIDRVVPFLECLRRELGHPLAVDTCRYEVAAAGLAAGACLINDISGLADERFAELASASGAALVIMHIRNRPRVDFHRPEHRWATHYSSVVDEVRDFLAEQAARAEALGVPADQLILDPGLGFDKLYYHDVALMRRLTEIRALGYPVLLATSHKNYLGESLGRPDLDPVGPTAAAVVWGIAQGADIVRIHDTGWLGPILRLAEVLTGRTEPAPSPPRSDE